MQFGNKCLEIKKVFATLILGTITFAIKFNGDNIDYKILGIAMIIILMFWMLDADSYYYQEKLRRTMTQRMNEIRAGRKLQSIYGVGMPIDKSRSESTMRARSFLNQSQIIYMISAVIIIIIGLSFYRFN